MPRYQLLKSLTILSCGVLFGYLVTPLMISSKTESHQIDFSSQSPDYVLSKMNSFQVSAEYFDVRIKHEIISEEEEGVSVVKALVTARKDLPAGLHFKWNLGEHVYSNDHVSGLLPEIKANQTYEVLLSVKGFTKASKNYLSFIITGQVDSHKLTREVLSSSRPEDSFEYFVQEQHRLEQENLKQDQNGKPSIQSNTTLKNKFNLENIIK